MHQSSHGGDTSGGLTVVMMEFAHHADELRNLYKVLSGDPEIKVIVMVTEQIRRKLGSGETPAPNVEMLVKKDKETVGAFLKSHAARIDQADVVYINTIKKYLRDLSGFDFKNPLLIRIHNVHSELDPWRHLDWSRDNFVSTLSYVVRRMLFQRKHAYRKKLLGKASGLLFANSEITRYARENTSLYGEKILPFNVPLTFMDRTRDRPLEKPESQPVIMAITGTIDRNRKDYLEVFEAISEVSGRFRRPVELRLLGRTKNSVELDTVKRLKARETENFRFHYNTEFVKSDEYRAMMSEVDFIVAPVRVHTVSSVFHETYGKSKMSGLENDIINNQKPALVTDRYQLPGELQGVCVTYHSTEHLGEMLVDWVNNSVFLEYSDHFKALDAYRPDTVRGEFKAMCRLVREN